jgi:hypothetical protein
LTFAETTDYEGLEVTEKMTCYTDERGESNRTPVRSMLVKSKTRWDGSQLVTKTSRDSMLSSSESLSPQHFRTTVKRELSSDGQTLTITTSMRGPDDTRVVRQVFSRAI